MFITQPKILDTYRTDQRIWQGIPSIEVTPKGRIFACFYSGKTTETWGNYCLLVKSEDGEIFSEPIAASYLDDDHRCFDPCVWIDPLGRLWFTWSVMPDHALYGVICEDPDAETLVWGEEFFIGHDVMMNKPVVLSSGEWIFPIAVWSMPWLSDSWRDKAQTPGAFAYCTVDNGRTFRKLGGALIPDKSFDEHMIVELSDGRLMMWVRTMHGIGVSYSWDRGMHWCDGKDTGIKSPSSRFHLARLSSGRLLLVTHKNFTGRNNLTAMLSDDDGKTWNEGLLLDERSGVSYPDVKEASDGCLYITYDHGRGAYKKCMKDSASEAREILYAKVTEADILAGKVVSKGSELKKVISRLGKYMGPDPNPFHTPILFDDRSYAKYLLQTETDIIGKVFDTYPIGCDRIAEAQKLDSLVERFRDCGEEDVLTEIVAEVRRLSVGKEQVPPVVERIQKEIADSIREPFSLWKLAEKIGMSRYYLCHLFKTHTGASVLQYRNMLQLTQAKKMLISSDEKISSIATKCGFDSV